MGRLAIYISLHITHDGTFRYDLEISPYSDTNKFIANGETVQTLSCILIHGRPSSTSKVFVALLSLRPPSS